MFGDSSLSVQQSEDGRFLYFVDVSHGLRVERRDLRKAGDLKTVYQNPDVVSFKGFVLHGNTLYVMLCDQNSDAGDVLAVHLVTGLTEKVMHLNRVAQDIASGFTISPDGKSLLVSETR